MTPAIAQTVHTMMIGFGVLGAALLALAVAVCWRALHTLDGGR